MSNYGQAIQVILAHEGGAKYTNNPKDPGGPTKFGLSLYRFFLYEKPFCFPWLSARGVRLSFAAPGSADDIKKLTEAQAIEVYRKCWWDFFGYERVLDQINATKVFDAAVNMPRPSAHACAQQAASAAGQPVDDDGIFGPRTVAAINACQPKAWLNAMVVRMKGYYVDLVTNHHADPDWLDGWLIRAQWPLPRERGPSGSELV